MMMVVPGKFRPFIKKIINNGIKIMIMGTFFKDNFLKILLVFPCFYLHIKLRPTNLGLFICFNLNRSSHARLSVRFYAN